MAKAGSKRTEGKQTDRKGKRTAPRKDATGLAAAAQKALAALRAIKAELEDHDLASLTGDERQHSPGKLRDGEDVAMTCVLDTVDAHAGQFASLAPHDHGTDDRAVETGPARDALARRAQLAEVGKRDRPQRWNDEEGIGPERPEGAQAGVRYAQANRSEPRPRQRPPRSAPVSHLR